MDIKKNLGYIFVVVALLGYLVNIGLIVFSKGLIYHTDVTESFDASAIPDKYFYTYNDQTGESLAEKARIPIFYGIYGTFQLLKLMGLDDTYYLKLKIYLVFATSLIAFIYAAVKTLEHLVAEKKLAKNPMLILISSVLGGLFYTSNFWFTNRIMHFGLFYTTVTLPIMFYFLYSYLFSKEVKLEKLVYLAIFLAVFTATPHTILFEGIIFFVLTCTFIFTENTNKSKKLGQLGIFILTTIILNMYWILPYASALSVPDAVLSKTIVNLLGKNAGFANSVRLMGYWLTSQSDYFLNIPKWLTYVAGIIPLAAFILSAKYIFKLDKKMAYIIVSIFLCGIFLATNSGITNAFYFYLMFGSPVRSLGWIFREYDKFGLLIAFAYSLSFVYLSFLTTAKKIVSYVALFLIVMSIFIGIQFQKRSIEDKYTPMDLPNDFKAVTSFLESDKDNFNIIWYPGSEKPIWTSNTEVRFVFSNLISPKGTITYNSSVMNYVEYIMKPENIYSERLDKSLNLLGTKYLILRKDESVFGINALEESLANQQSMQLVYKTDLLSVYLNKSYAGMSQISPNLVITNAGLGFLKSNLFKADNDFDFTTEFTDKPSNIAVTNKAYYMNPADINDVTVSAFSDDILFPYNYLTIKDDGNPGQWKLGTLENINNAETDVFFGDLGLNIDQFDYQRGVAIARDGWEKIEPNKAPVKSMDLMFSQHPNVIKKAKNFEYNSVDTNFKYYWNIIRSDIFTFSQTRALEIKLSEDIDPALTPHFKLYTYKSDGQLINIYTLYPGDDKKIDTVLKLDTETAAADFSIWTLSNTGKGNYSYSLRDLSISDISDNVKPISMNVPIKDNCYGNCVVLIRALQSFIGGNVRVKLGNEEALFYTKVSEDAGDLQRMNWYAANLQIPENNKNNSFTIESLDGFNVVNAVAIVNSDKFIGALDKAKNDVISNSPLLFDKATYRVKTTEINPTKIKLDIYTTPNTASVLTLARPFSKSWVLYDSDHKILSDKPVLVNGYITGWNLDQISTGTLYAEYTPQKYFYIGSYISIVSLAGLLVYLLLNKLVIASDRKSTSQG